MKKRQRLLTPKKCYVSEVAVVFDTLCCCGCSCPEHRTGKIRSELRFEEGPEGFPFRAAMPFERERRGRGVGCASAVRSRAKWVAVLIGVPFVDETVPLSAGPRDERP